ncbi:MAG: RNA polymerase sigma factor [Eubacteriales bacterium]|nr:RNA polymerase sigma factor [Eubacteriales bacterium]
MNKKYQLTEYVDRLYHAALAKTGDSHVAEDIVQETFLAAISALSKGKEPDNVWGWLYSIMSNKYCDWLREKYNKPQISFDDYPFDIPDETLDDDSEQKLSVIRRELGYLAKTHREVMVRFYMHGDSIEKISCDLNIPQGTVKSRLNTGRKHIKEGVGDMENYTKQSYEPDMLRMSCSGAVGLGGEPFSLVDYTDKLTQNVLILAYPKPTTETELAKALGTPVAFIEPVVEKMIAGELMKRTDSGKVYTDFIIYTEKDRKATFESQLNIVSEHFDVFWKTTKTALEELRKKDYYIRQSEHSKAKLELHFCIKLLLNAHIDVRNEVTGVMPFSEYPYRQNGGRWIAM